MREKIKSVLIFFEFIQFNITIRKMSDKILNCPILSQF